MSRDGPTSDLILPPSLARMQTQAGSNRKYMKVLVFGESGGGKSYFLSKFPKPVFAISAGGERGIEQFLDKEQGDLSFAADNPEEYLKLIDFAIENQGLIGSLVIDPITTTWEDWLDYWSEQLGGEIGGGQWRHVKGPWKLMQRKLLKAQMHVGMAAWLKDLVYYKDPSPAPGVEGKLQIKPQEVPQVEKRIPHFMDMVFQCSVVRDGLNKPMPKHEVVVAKGRRPASVPPKEFHVGKRWVFDGKKENDTWATVIEPLLAKWVEHGVDDVILGMEPTDVREAFRSLDEVAQDASLGQVIMAMERAKTGTWKEYEERTWPLIRPAIAEMNTERQDRVKVLHNELKVLLKGEGK